MSGLVGLLESSFGTGAILPPAAPSVSQVFATNVITPAAAGANAAVFNGISTITGGLVWTKYRSGADDHRLYDTIRGIQNEAYTNSDNAPVTNTSRGVIDFTLAGYTFQTQNGVGTYVGWTFKEAPRFFDISPVTIPASGITTIPHSLGVMPGMIIQLNRSMSLSKVVFHKGLGFENYLRISTNTAMNDAGFGYGIASSVNALSYQVETARQVNQGEYVMYLFADDPAPEGVIRCSNYIGNGSSTTVTLGWQPQFVMVKSTGVGDWQIFDSVRGASSGTAKGLRANTNAAEFTSSEIYFTSTGFVVSGGLATNGQSFIFTAIRSA